MGFITKSRNITIQKKRGSLYSAVIVGLLCLVVTVTLFIIDPILIITKHFSRVANGSYVHEALMEHIKGVHISAYLFNITNTESFQRGEDQKLRVEEVGPFTYQETRINEKLEIDLKAGVIRYTPKQDVKFLPEESVGHPEDFNVTLPNIAMLSMASKVSSSYFGQMAFNLLALKYNSKAVVKMPAVDYLWGYEEPLIKLGNTLLPGLVSFGILGILDRLYDKKAILSLEVSARDEDKFAIRTVNGLKGLPMWGYEDAEKRDNCNTFNNVYEGIAYPPQMTPERPIRVYRSIFCRFLELDYFGETTTSYGAKGMVYKISNRTFTYNNNTKCLCNKGICQDGISDMSSCFLGLPIVLSNAHFLHADPKLYERVEGMRPDEGLHGSSFIIEPTIGMVLGTLFSIQVNVLVRDVRFNAETKPFSDMLVPIVNVKIVQPEIRPIDIYHLRLIHVYGPYICIVIRAVFAIVGLLLLAYILHILYKNWIYSTTNSLALQNMKTPQKFHAEEPLIN